MSERGRGQLRETAWTRPGDRSSTRWSALRAPVTTVSLWSLMRHVARETMFFRCRERLHQVPAGEIGALRQVQPAVSLRCLRIKKNELHDVDISNIRIDVHVVNIRCTQKIGEIV